MPSLYGKYTKTMPNLFYWLIFLSFLSCQAKEKTCHSCQEETIKDQDSLKTPFIKQDSISKIERLFIDLELISIDFVCPNIRVALAYSDTHNFMHQNMYGSLVKAYMQKETAMKLCVAQQYLNTIDSNLCLLIFDAARPQSIQKYMWNHVKLPAKERSKYLMNPQKISGHNYGISIDLTIYNKANNSLLDMGSPFDYFGEISEPRHEPRLLSEGKLSKAQIKNRTLLRKVMNQAGFTGIVSEWWHFNAMSRKVAGLKYQVIP